MAIEPRDPNENARDVEGISIFGTLMKVVAVLGVIVVFIGLLLPAPRVARESDRRIQCWNNLKPIMLGLRNYAEKYDVFPPAYTVDAAGKPMHSWRTLILPYVEQEELYKSIDLTKPWNDPVNSTAFKTQLNVYLCPSMGNFNNETTYRAMVGPNACFLPTKPRRLDEITDPHESTVAVIEGPVDQPVPWMAPIDADESLFQSLTTTPGSRHPGGANVGMVDGSVKFLKATCPADVRHALSTIAGKDVPRADQY